MIYWGIILLIVGVVLWGVGRILAPRPAAHALLIVGEVCGAIGLILLIVGLVVMLLAGHNADVQLDGLRALVWG